MEDITESIFNEGLCPSGSPTASGIASNEKIIILGDRITTDCEMEILYMNKYFDNTEYGLDYLKGLYKRIDDFHKKHFKNLSTEELYFIKLLQKYNKTEIKKSINSIKREMTSIQCKDSQK